MALYELSAAEMLKGLGEKKFTSLELVEACLKRMETMEPSLKAMLTVSADEARQKAREMDRARAEGRESGLLAGIPVVLKDNMCTRMVRTTCGSRMLENWIPPYDATVVELLEEEGAIILGKSNMDEFAMGGSTENSAFGPTSNPWDLERVPGGSSGGSAAAIAAGYAPIALGSDTGGSIRQPAAFCGIYGMKPTYGRVSRYGLVAFASSLDQIGPFARTVEDLALAMKVIARFDARDSTSVRRETPDYMDALKASDLKGKRVGIIKEIKDCPVSEEIRGAMNRAIDVCRTAGADIIELSLPTVVGYGVSCYYILAPAEASSNLARYDGVRYGFCEKADNLIDMYTKTRRAGFGEEVKRRILTGTYVLSSGYYDAYYLTAQKVRRLIMKEFNEAFDSVDTVLLPTSPTPAFRKGELLDDPIQMYMADVFTIPVNMAGLPGLSLNVDFSEKGLPLGVQFVGPKWGEMELLSMAAVLERTFGKAAIAEGGRR